MTSMCTTREKFKSFYYQDDVFPEIKVNIGTTALLIVDMQNEFILRDYGEAQQFKEAGVWERWIPFHDRLDEIVIPNNVKLLQHFRNYNMTVTYGRIASLRDDGADRSAVQKSDGWNGINLHVDSFAAQMIDELEPKK